MNYVSRRCFPLSGSLNNCLGFLISWVHIPALPFVDFDRYDKVDSQVGERMVGGFDTTTYARDNY